MPTDQLRRTALNVWIAVGSAALAYGILRVADSVRIIWLPIAFAGGLVFILEPAVRALERIKIPRIAGSILAVLGLAALLVAASALIFPLVREQAVEFAQQAPDLYTAVVEWLTEMGGRVGMDVTGMLSFEGIGEWLNDPANQETLQNLLVGFGVGAGRVIRTVTEMIAVVGLAPVLAVYILIDLDNFKRNTLGLTPPKHQEEVTYVAGAVGGALGSFVRGQILVAVIVGVMSSIGMALIGLPFWLLIGIISGFLNLIPFLGPTVGGALAALVALLDGDLWQALWAVVVMVIIQQIDNHVITPVVQRARVNLSPLVIILALVIGGSLAGLLGVLVAVPATAAIRILVGHFWRTRVLGQSWREASEAMIEVTEPPERLARISRRPSGQTPLFDTQELPPVEDPNGRGQADR